MYRFEPPINDKRSMTKDDWPGWYQLSVVREGKLVAVCRWWSGKRWGFDPHHKRGFLMSEMGDVRGIVRLVEE